MAKQRPAQIILLDFAQAGLVIEGENDRIGATDNQRAEMLGADASVTTGQNDRPLDQVAQFPDIARPRIALHQFNAGGHDAFRLQTFVLGLLGVSVDEDSGIVRSFINASVWGGIALGIASMVKEKNKVMIATTAGTSDLTGKACTPNTISYT